MLNCIKIDDEILYTARTKQNIEIYSPNIKRDIKVVCIDCTVELKNLNSNEVLSYTIEQAYHTFRPSQCIGPYGKQPNDRVLTNDYKVDEGVILNTTPVAQKLIGKWQNDKVVLFDENGKAQEYIIQRIYTTKAGITPKYFINRNVKPSSKPFIRADDPRMPAKPVYTKRDLWFKK